MADLKLISYAGGKLLTAGSGDNVQIGDNVKLQIGDGQDLELYHDGTASFVSNKTGALKIATETSDVAITIGHTTSEVTIADNLTVTGDLTVQGDTTTITTTNTIISDKLIELANGTTGVPSGDAGIVIERGDSDNAIFAWDESHDQFVLGTTTATGASSGDLTITAAALEVGQLTLTDIVLDSATITGITTNAEGIGGSGQNVDTNLPTTLAVKSYVDSAISGGTATALSSATDVNITADSGTANSSADNSIVLEVGNDTDGSEIVAQANASNFDVKKTLVLSSTAGVSLSPASAAVITAGQVLALDSSGLLQVASADDTYQELIGVALEGSADGSTAAILVHTIHGSKITVKSDGAGVTQGSPVYLDPEDSAGKVSSTAPTAGYVYRAGIAIGAESGGETEILWMPQFVADLG